MKSANMNQAMEILKQLRQIAESNEDISLKLEKIITMIVQQMKADAGADFLIKRLFYQTLSPLKIAFFHKDQT